jgi:hypothetical protein
MRRPINRHALVIGVAAYPSDPLANSVEDARRIAGPLERRGFTVTLVIDPDRDAMGEALTAFHTSAAASDLALIYLAGHAVERHGTGYFLPIDFPFPANAGALRHRAIALNELVDATNGASSRIIVLDTCRNWPAESDDQQRVSNDIDHLAQGERDWPNLLLAFATSARMGAGDGRDGEGSAFTRALCHRLLDHNFTVDECFRRVSQDVVAQRRQQPWAYSSLRETFSFSDLPRFRPIHRHAVPNPEHLGSAWLAPCPSKDALVIGLGDGRAWYAGLSGWGSTGHRDRGRIVGAADLHNHLLLAESEGTIFALRDGEEVSCEIETDSTFGIVAAPDRTGAVHLGKNIVTILRDGEDELEIVSQHDVGFDAYCAAYVSTDVIWVAGGQGRICEITRLGSKELEALGSLDFWRRGHINALAVSPDGNRVFAVGQSGVAVSLDRDGKIVEELLVGRSLTTAAGIRAKLLEVATDEVISDFLFARAALDDDVVNALDEHVDRPCYHACAHDPVRPILVIGTEESSIIVLDTRDGQIVQEIDIGSGFTAEVSGMHFLGSGELAVVDGRGHVTFFRS